MMVNSVSWDFRQQSELEMSKSFEEKGYVVENGNSKYLDLMRDKIQEILTEYADNQASFKIKLERAHEIINKDQSNILRLHIMNEISKDTSFHRNYYEASKEIIHNLCGNELAMQKRPGLSINFPNNHNDVLPIHADTWNGVSPFELNIWLPFVDCSRSMCLYILKRSDYQKRLENSKGLLKLSSDDLFNELKAELTWIPIKYGEILAFDQSLPHGFALNEEDLTHWSFNCRFKGLHTPYWDKKLGEYFIPITVKTSTRIGMHYKHPKEWI